MNRKLCLFILIASTIWVGERGRESAAFGETAGVLPSEKPARQERTLVAFGDSLTAGFGVAAEEAYPALLAKRMEEEGYNYRVINAGVSGDTTAGGLRRVDWVLKSRPDIVILELGANDGLRGLDLQLLEKNLSEIIERLLKGQARVVLAGMKIPSNYGKEYTKGFEAIYPRLARRFHLTLIPFFLQGVAAQSTLNQADGVHPTAQGYRIIVDAIWPFLTPHLEKN